MSELWCYAESLPDEGEVVLSAEEARHVSARRLKVGDKLVVFDGAGSTYVNGATRNES